MKKKVVAFLLATGLFVSLVSCRGTERTEEPGAADQKEETTQDVSNMTEDAQTNDANADAQEAPAENAENGENSAEAENGDTEEQSDPQQGTEAGTEDMEEPHALSIAGSDNYLSEWLEEEQITLYNIQYQKLYLGQDEDTAEQEGDAASQGKDEAGQSEASALVGTFDAYNEKLDADMQSSAEELKRTAQEALDNGMLEAAYTITQQYQIVRADDVVFSAWSKTDSYTGGAHPFYTYDGIAVDTATGRELQLSDVVTDTTAMAKQLAEQLTDSYDENDFSDLPITLQSMLKSNTLEWALGNEGLEFCFAPGNLAPYAVGAVSTVIRYEEMPELFNEKYTKTAKRYTRGFSVDDVQRVDIDGDGESEEILLSRDFGESEGADGISTGIRMQIDSKAYVFESIAYGYTCYLVHLEEDKWYLYLDGVSDNDYHTLYVFDLNGEEPQKIQELYGTGFHTDYRNEDAYEYPQDYFTDPEAFRLDVRTDLLSTLPASRFYRVGADGNPEAKQDYYYYDTDRELTSRIDLELEFPEEGTKETVPAGSIFRFYRTDNENFVDMKLDDGRVCRVEADNSDWPVRINGTDREEVFDGMVFAG